MPTTAARTSIVPMVLVAVEQFYPPEQRIVDDSLALQILPAAAKIFVSFLRPRWTRDWMINATERSNPGIWGGLLCRKRYIDEKLVASRDEIEAIVNLRAGFDTRAYRLSALSGLPVWEIDQHENIGAKVRRLRRVLGTIPSNIKLVSIDFDRDDIGATLVREGYSSAKRTFFIWEGVTQYLTEQGVRATFDFLSRAAPGSRLACTYVRQDFLDGTNLYGWPSGYERFVATKLWQFGLTPETCTEFLQHYGWHIIEDAAYAELAKKYIRPTGRQLPATPVERMVYAERHQ